MKMLEQEIEYTPTIISLSQVQKRLVLKEANEVNLHCLLLLTSPELTLEEVSNNNTRVCAVKKLLYEIHPSNYPDNEDAQQIFEDVQNFYERCCDKINGPGDEVSSSASSKKKRRKGSFSPTSVINTVVQFNVRQQWPFLDNYLRPLPPVKITSGKLLAPLVAYQCINLRGAIAHGKQPSLIYSWDNAFHCNRMTVEEVFKKHGGSRIISGRNINQIKVEIIERGPVVSLTFVPSKNFALEYKDCIIEKRINKRHYCLIIGWKITEFGEVWLVRDYAGTRVMEIPIGHYDIDEKIIAPKSNFENICWQKGPYFDVDLSEAHGWLDKDTLQLNLNSSALEIFASALGDVGFQEAIEEKTRFVIRDKTKLSNSKSSRLTEVKWDKNSKLWNVYCSFRNNYMGK